MELFLKASQAEAEGNISLAIKLYSQAYRLDPKIDRHPQILTQTNSSHTKSTIGSSSVNNVKYVDAKLEREIMSKRSSEFPCELTANIWLRVFFHLAPFPFAYESLSATCSSLYSLSHTKNERLSLIKSSRVRFDGIYIAKFTYFREGESQLSYLHPVHLVTYYRYLRFDWSDTDGAVVLSLTTPAEPQKILSTLRDCFDDKKQVDNLLKGTWLFDKTSSRLKITLNSSLTYILTGTIANTPRAATHRNNVIQLDSYIGYHGSQEMINFDVKQWPKYRFSRVRSYHLY